ncbi:SurA N-terminal domain-containing protein [Pseudooceanicola sp. CBS1P-1]|uniref:Parvulin-like PPIase n=1 Tax=Pseudooceanicola albus TaxID=2692189 RepID=A0A6L7G955_9RHOB|nr:MULTISPECIES: peptidyl-prolyl cis-trans isomerase [Pseudooceanicola]MBT9384478.1 SurA N-terminal domain-containing protein [Pseudooceanicola endophyticus]MXN20621.1 peptidylprolyl isomerase [Pseudooceanicola albus]
MAAKKSKSLVWGLMILLILGLGGFGATSFSGTVTTIGKVGDKPIRASAYANAVQSQMNSIGQQMGNQLTFQQAQMFGIPNAAISQLVDQRALDVEAEKIGLSVGDANVAKQIEQIQAFKGLDGKFSRENYNDALKRVGLHQADFESDLRDESARSILQGAIVSSTRMPAAYAKTLASYIGETRAVTYGVMTSEDLKTPVATPTEDELQAYYKDHIAEFTDPEKKRITYAILSPDDLLDEVHVDQANIDAQYEQRKDEFERPERRLVERLVFPDAASAKAAKAKLDDGSMDFDALVKSRGLDLSDIDMGDVAQSDLSTKAAGDAVFAAKSDTVVGPVDSDLGPALYRINGILTSDSTPKAEAEKQIREDLAADAARRAVAAKESDLEDELAGGATLEDLTKNSKMQLQSIDWYKGMTDGIAAYSDFGVEAAKLTADDYPEIKELDDGSIYAMRLDKEIPSAPQPFEDVKSKVAEAWTKAQTLKALDAQAQDLIQQMKDGKTALASTGLQLTTETDVTRNGSVLGTPDGFNAAVFAMKKGDYKVLDDEERVLILRLDSVAQPAADDSDNQSMQSQIESRVSSSLAQDLYEAYIKDVRARVDVKINEDAVNAVNGQFR